MRFLALLLFVISSGQQPVLSVSFGVSIRPAARMPLRRGHFVKRSPFKWSAGGLDLNEKSLAALKESPEPPQEPPSNLRTYLEKQGYTIRTKISKSDIPKMKNSAKDGSQICAAATSAQGACSSRARGQQPVVKSTTSKRTGPRTGANSNTPKRSP